MTTKAEMMKNIAWKYDDVMSDGAVTSSAANILQCAAFVFPNAKQLQGMYAFVYGGASNELSRVIGTYTPSDNEIVWAEVAAVIPSTNNSVMILKNYKPDTYLSAFELAYHKTYHDRLNNINKWNEWTDGITQREANWVAERNAEMNEWVDVKKKELDQWHAEQVSWEQAISGDWLSLIGNLRRPEQVFIVPSLHINTPGTLVVATLAVGSLAVATLSLTTVPSIGDVGSMGDTVVDEPILQAQWSLNLLASGLDSEITRAQYSTALEDYTSHANAEKELVSNLIQSMETLWGQYTQQFVQTWDSHKNRYEQNFERFKGNYDNHKSSAENRLISMKNQYLGGS